MTKSIQSIDWQGHRGCRGLLPENSIPAFIHALEYPIQTLELDVVVSKDEKIIVSHEPWFSAAISTHPEGHAVNKEEEEKLLLYNMTYDEIQAFDCGSRGNKRFPKQKSTPVSKPSFKDMVHAVESYCKQNNRKLPLYNIEMKSQPDYYGQKVPPPATFVALMLAEIEQLDIKERINLQSFDIQVLEEIHRQDDSIIIAYLVENLNSFEKNISKLSFQPDIYSPYYKFVRASLVEKVHQKGMKLIPWTVNETKDMHRLIQLGVDGIITDFPNKIREVADFYTQN